MADDHLREAELACDPLGVARCPAFFDDERVEHRETRGDRRPAVGHEKSDDPHASTIR
jgi:hypothetical protein